MPGPLDRRAGSLHLSRAGRPRAGGDSDWFRRDVVDLPDASANYSDGTRLLPDLRHGARTHDAARAEAEPNINDLIRAAGLPDQVAGLSNIAPWWYGGSSTIRAPSRRGRCEDRATMPATSQRQASLSPGKGVRIGVRHATGFLAGYIIPMPIMPIGPIIN